MSVATGSSSRSSPRSIWLSVEIVLDRVLVDRVVVVHVELHHRHDPAEFRDEGAEHADLVHQPQRPLRVVVAEQQRQEDPVRVRVARAPRRRSARGWPRPGAARRDGSRMPSWSASSKSRRMLTGSARKASGSIDVEPAVPQPVALAAAASLPPVKTPRSRRAMLGRGLTWRASSAARKMRVRSPTFLACEEIGLHEPLHRPLAGGRLRSRGSRRSRPGCRRSAARSRGPSAGADGPASSRGTPRPRRRSRYSSAVKTPLGHQVVRRCRRG